MSEQAEASQAGTLGKPALDATVAGRQVERLPGAHLSMELNNEVSLRFPSLGLRYEGRIVGLDPYNYFIVQARLPQDTLTRAAANPNIVVQLRSAGILYGFRTDIMNRVSNPAPLLFLSYPVTVERMVLRRDQRVRVNLPGAIHGPYGDHEVVVTDLTPSGCRLSVRTDLKNPLRSAAVGDKIVLTCEMGSDQPVTCPLALRSIEEAKGLITLGCQFVDHSEQTASHIEAYVQKLLRFSHE